MEGHLLLSEKERRRMLKFGEVAAGRMSLTTAADYLGLSYRQAKRSYRRYRELGDAGLAHQSRGRASNRRMDPAFRAAVLERYRQAYEGYGPTLAAEELAQEGLVVDHETLRRWLLAEGLWAKKRKRRQHRMRRPRRARFGELLQIDGSIHQWFAGDDRYYCLLSLVDDATGTTMALMDYGETTEGAMRLLWMWIERYGVPQAIYADKKSVFFPPKQASGEDEEEDSKQPDSAFALACHKLGIETIRAHSPQAKGRVERKHAVYQDRLIKKMAQLGITSVEGANQLLTGGFCDLLNAKFAQPPAQATGAHRPVKRNEDLAQIFCREQTRCLTNDWCIIHQKSWYHIEKSNRPLPKPKDHITVRILLDGSIHLFCKNRRLRFKVLSQPPQKLQKTPKPIAAKPKTNKKPAPNHPWRRLRYGSKKKDKP